MKRIFISVGSEGLKVLVELINRLRMENLFDKFNDMYFAIDSDKKAVQIFNNLQKSLNTDRIQGILMSISEDDNCVEKSFQQGWTVKEVPPGGVGGDRTISGKAVSFFKQLWMSSNHKLDEKLRGDDHIIVVGTAFGGTSSGLFLNVCEYLDYIIRNKRSLQNDYGNIEVTGYLAMPEGVPADDDYPFALNMIDLFRDLQSISWQRRLESERPGFKVPTWAQYDNKGYFPLFNKTNNTEDRKITEYGICGSTLPFGTLYIIPTSYGVRTYLKSIFAETLFVGSYLHIDNGHVGWINRLKKGAGFGSPEKDITVEDKCLGGYNMFVMKSGQMRTLKNWFNKGVLGAISGDQEHRGLNNPCADDSLVIANICKVFQDRQIPDRMDTYAGLSPKGDNANNALSILIDAFQVGRTNLTAFRDFVSKCPVLLKSVESSIKEFSIIPSNELITCLGNNDYKNWNKGIDFILISKGYRAFYSIVQNEKNKKSLYHGKLKEAINDALQLAEQRIGNRVTKKWLFGLGQMDAVFQEVMDVFEDAFKKILQLYLFSCRCAATTFITPDAFDLEIEKFAARCKQISDDIEKMLNSISNDKNPFILEGHLLDPLVLPDTVKDDLQFSPLKILLDVTNESFGSDDKEAGMQRLGVEEEKMISKLIELTSKLDSAANPLSEATIADFDPDTCLTYSSQLKVSDSGTYHYHFAIKRGNASSKRGNASSKRGNASSLLNDHVCNSPLYLSTMPGTANGAAPFFSEQHTATKDKDYWYDGARIDSNATSNLQGVWIGTLGIDFSVKEILDRLYSEVPNVKSDWNRAAKSSPFPRRLLTTVEMVCFGIIIEAIEGRIQEEWKKFCKVAKLECKKAEDHSGEVEISIESDGCTPFKLPRGTLSQIGFETPDKPKNDTFGFETMDESDCKMVRISLAWTKYILDWIRNPSEGFKAFFPTYDFQSIKNTEANIFTDIRFRILPEEKEKMDSLKMLVANCIKIKFK